MEKESADAGHLNDHHGRDFMGADHVHTSIASGPYTGPEKPLAERVAIDYARAHAQLKAEHAKEDAVLAAEAIQMQADLKAQHAMTEGETGLLAKLRGNEDPMKSAEKKHLNAEILRAKEIAKAEHACERAELEAKEAKAKAAVKADKLTPSFNSLALGPQEGPPQPVLDGQPLTNVTVSREQAAPLQDEQSLIKPTQQGTGS